MQVRKLELLEAERRQHALQVGRENCRVSQADVLEKGLLGVRTWPGKFEEALTLLEILADRVRKRDFSMNLKELVRGLYGKETSLRGAQISNVLRSIAQRPESAALDEKLCDALFVLLQEEIRDLIEEYQLLIEQDVRISRAERHAAIAPTRAERTMMLRQQNALNRHIERKLKLLEQI